MLFIFQSGMSTYNLRNVLEIGRQLSCPMLMAHCALFGTIRYVSVLFLRMLAGDDGGAREDARD
jgi:hypothetical protein